MRKRILVKAIYKSDTPTKGFVLAFAELVTAEANDDEAGRTASNKLAQPIVPEPQVAVRDDTDA